jgi:hypothetical protein
MRNRLAAGLFLAAAVTLGALAAGCGKGEPVVPPDPNIDPPKGRTASTAKAPSVYFTDITARSGINFVHTNGSLSGEMLKRLPDGKPIKLLPETMGSGVAVLDADGDGLQDILFVNSCYWPGYEDRDKPAPTLALYRNLGGGKFEDVTARAGLAVTMYGMGVTVGDFDNDGRPDVFITGVGGNRLFRNVSDKDGIRFVDVTREAGDLVKADSWPAPGEGDFLKREKPLSFPSSAAFLDYDGDGLLDIFVCNYVSWSPVADLSQGFNRSGRGRTFGPPTAFGGTHCTLYRNLGGGKFEDVTARAGIQVFGERGRPGGKSLGVVVCDADGDGWPDIIVANDTVRNFFFHNQGDGTFKEKGLESGIAYAEGSARGAMGIDWGQYRPGRWAALVGNFANEPNTFLRLDNPKLLFFSDAALSEGIAGPSRSLLKFGVFFFDYDLDGRQDLLTCNGHLEPIIHLLEGGQQYKQPAQLFWNTGGQPAFEPVSPAEAGADLFKPLVGRGCAYLDLDGNGYPDVVLTENGGPARLLRNEGAGNHWIRFVLEGDGKRSNRSAIGAHVTLYAGGVVQQREVTSARGYLSQSELPVTFGLGKTAKVDRVEIRWPGRNGSKQVVDGKDLAIDRTHPIRQEAK